MVAHGICSGSVEFGGTVIGPGTNAWIAWLDRDQVRRVVWSPYSRLIGWDVAGMGSEVAITGFIPTGAGSFFGQTAGAPGTFVAIFDATGACTHFFQFPGATEAVPRVARMGDKLAVLLVGNSVEFAQKKLAPDAKLYAHVVVLKW